ncbi:MAG TPA: hypothetical protein DEB10_13870 [Ruminococcaceae bacterium]|nr:hypothetical protein [Oscillospiraceae bacterium]
MPKDLFNELDEEKKGRIISAGIAEFAQYSYNESSTNRIVKNAGISKGSLFKYFQSKEELYFYILDYIIAELMSSLEKGIERLPKDLLKRVIEYSELEFDWYVQNPDKYKLFKKAFINDNTEIYRKVKARYKLAGEGIYYEIFEEASTEQLNQKKERNIDILKWFLKGFNEEFINEMDSQDGVDNVKKEYLRRLKEYVVILREGLM